MTTTAEMSMLLDESNSKMEGTTEAMFTQMEAKRNEWCQGDTSVHVRFQ
jgi:hypothetical protein